MNDRTVTETEQSFRTARLTLLLSGESGENLASQGAPSKGAASLKGFSFGSEAHGGDAVSDK